MRRTFLAFAACVAFSGCVSKNTLVENEKDVFIIGKTTQREVVLQWGNPDSVRGNVWGWKDWRVLGSKFRLGYMGVGITVANSEMATSEHLLTFDANGVLKARELREGKPGGPHWAALPE